MPYNIPCLLYEWIDLQVHSEYLSQMWVDCYPSEDTNDSEGGEIMSNVCPMCHTRTGIHDVMYTGGAHTLYWCCICGNDYLIPILQEELE